MKLRSVCRVGAVVVLLIGVLTACRGRQQSNWRTPNSAPTPCASDADCGGGTCTIEPSATQGTCAPIGLVPMQTDAGSTGPNPGPDVRPSPSDIQI